MKIAIASSGLGHIARGIETWAFDTAVALEEVSRKTLDVEVTLFAAAPLQHLTSDASPPLTIRVIPCLKRGNLWVRLVTRISPGFTWRWGWKSAYGIEQRSFWQHLWPILREEGFDILHVQDPLLADLCRKYRKVGKVRTKEILAHGTEESVEFLEKFEYVQHLAPWHLDETLGHRPKTPVPKKLDGKSHWIAMPNFVDCEVFRPVESHLEKQALRDEFGIPGDAMVYISVAARKRGHKRVDQVISEFKAAALPDSFLILAGAKTDETQEIRALAGGDTRIRIFQDYPHEKMSMLLRVADVMVLGSLFEMMPIAILEGLASGLPVISHDHPVMVWITGAHEAQPGGWGINLEHAGVLSHFFGMLNSKEVMERGRHARERALRMFSKEVVIGQYVEYYEKVVKHDLSHHSSL